MGDYSYSEHIEIFGGPPEPGEAYPDLEQVDLLRKEQKENPPPEVLGDSARHYVNYGRDCMEAWSELAGPVREALGRKEPDGHH